MQVLAGDIGGTKVLLQIAEFDKGNYQVKAEQRFASNAYDGLLPIIQEFLRTPPARTSISLDSACFGIAGPISETPTGQLARVTNLPWEVKGAVLARELKLSKLRLMNDFQAIGYGIEALDPQDLAVLQEGEAVPHAPRIVIGAGTGLGQGLLIWQGDHYEAIATEGGHVDFGPTDALQMELLQYLKKKLNHVSYERVLSGSGLVTLYNFLHDREAPTSSDLTEAMKTGDPAAVISDAALKGKDALAIQALDLFVTIYGAQAGNFALSCLAEGGVYIAGGIAPKIIDKLTDGTFMRAFTSKGRMSSLVQAMPVKVVMNPKVGLMGAALAASRL